MAFSTVVAGSEKVAANVRQIIDALSGTSGGGQAIALTQLNDASSYALDIKNLDSTNGLVLRLLDEADNVIATFTRSAITLSKATVITTPTFAGTLTVPVNISNTTLGADAASVDITSIPATYAHLMLICYLRGKKSATYDTLAIRCNNDSTSGNYFSQEAKAQNTTLSAYEVVSGGTYGYLGTGPANTAVANSFGATIIHIPHYANAVNKKVMYVSNFSVEAQATGSMNLEHLGAYWTGTAAINRLTIYAVGGNLASGSRVTLYGLP